MDILVTTQKFSRDYFKVGDPVKITDTHKECIYALIKEVDENTITTTTISYKSYDIGMGHSGYDVDTYHIRIGDYLKGNVKIFKLSEDARWI